MSSIIGQTIGRYQIIEQIGVGGMATVYKAFDTRLKIDVAFKVIQTEAFPRQSLGKMLARFNREAKTLANLQHPNIVRVIDFGEFDQMPYLVMEYLTGGTLKEQMGKTMPYKKAAEILIPIARALGYAHHQGIVHRDVKPSNIMFSHTGTPMLTDFGVAKLVEEQEDLQTLTGTGLGVGTPAYMAPEQGLGKIVDGRADEYSLGIIFYELLAGKKPYIDKTPMGIALKHSTDPIPDVTKSVKGIPPLVRDILYIALAKKPENRFPKTEDFADELATLLDDAYNKRSSKIFERKFSERFAQDVKTELIDIPNNHKIVRKPDCKKLIFGIIGVLALLTVGYFVYKPQLTHPGIQQGIPPVSQALINTEIISTAIPVMEVVHTLTATTTVTITPTEELDSTPTIEIKKNSINSQNILSIVPTIVLPIDQNRQLFFAFSPDNKIISVWQNNAILSYNVNDGSLASKLDFTGGSVTSLEYSPDGKYLAASSEDNIVYVWTLGDQKLISKLTGHKDVVTDLVFSPDSRYLTSSSKDNNIFIWDVNSASIIDKLSSGAADILTVDYSPDGKTLVAGSADSRVHFFQMVDQVFDKHKGKVVDVKYSPDGNYLSSIGDDKSIMAITSENNSTVFTYTDKEITEFSLADQDFSIDGSVLAVSVWDKKMATLYQLFIDKKGSLINKITITNAPFSNIRFSPDGQILVAYTDHSGSGLGLFVLPK